MTRFIVLLLRLRAEWKNHERVPLGKIDCRIEYQERIDFCLWENPAGALGDIMCLIDAVQDYAACVDDLD